MSALVRKPHARRVLRPITLGLAAACALMGRPAPSGAEEPPSFNSPPPWHMSQAQDPFAVDLYARLKDTPGNLLFSPHSIHTALAMTRAGARGETAAQMDRVLRADVSPETWQILVRNLTAAPRERERRADGTQADAPTYSLSVANALFGQKGYPFDPAYRELLTTHFGAELRDVDFAAGPAVRKEINDWVLSKTNDKIKDLIPEGLPTADTRLTLVNAIHFLAQWAEPFSESATEDADFTGADGTKTKVRMMRRTGTYSYLDDGDVEVAALWYRGHKAQMLIVRPKAVDGLAAVEKALTHERLSRWGNDGKRRKLALGLPRFRFEAPIDLTSHLQALGMTDAFTPSKADFSGMVSVRGQPLFIGAVLHKAFIAVDEKGTEAAAATAVMKRAGSAMKPEDPLPFVCDRPFLFVLRCQGVPLFLGRLVAPTPEPAPPASPQTPVR
jgi:serpin B